MSDELKPCPFCGKSDAPRVVDENEAEGIGPEGEGFVDIPYFAVVCSFTNGGCGASGGYRDTEERAIDAWNRRDGERDDS